MESLWNSLDTVNTIRLIAQWTVAVSGIIALVFTMRSTTLKNNQDAINAKVDSDKRMLLEKKIQTADSELGRTQKQLEDTKTRLTQRITEAEQAAKPRPLQERLRTLLASIDPKILPALKSGTTHFGGGITATQFYDLQKIAKEPGAAKYIAVSPDVKMGLGMGAEGVTYGVDFTLDPQLLKE